MKTKILFKKLLEQINLEAALQESGFDALEIAQMSNCNKDMLLSEFFDKIEDYLKETIYELMIDHFTSMNENKEPLKLKNQ